MNRRNDQDPRSCPNPCETTPTWTCELYMRSGKTEARGSEQLNLATKKEKRTKAGLSSDRERRKKIEEEKVVRMTMALVAQSSPIRAPTN